MEGGGGTQQPHIMVCAGTWPERGKGWGELTRPGEAPQGISGTAGVL